MTFTHRRALGPGRLEKAAGAWKLHWTDERGRRRRKVLGTDRRTAERLRGEIIHRRDLAIAGLGTESGLDRPLAGIGEQYLADLKPRVTCRHYAQVEARLRRALDELGPLRVRDLTSGALVAVRNRRLADGAGHRTANLVVTTVQAALRWAAQNGLIAASPVEHIKKLPETRDHQRYRRRAMTEAEIAAFLAASQADDEENALRADLDGWTRVAVTPLWQTLLETGARWNELRQATWADLDLERRVLVLRAENTKSRRVRAIPLREDLTAELRRLRVIQESVLGRLPNKTVPIFLSPEGMPWPRPTTNPMRILDRVLDRAGIAKVDAVGEKLDLHALRHTAATRLARAGVPLVQAQRILGHSDPKLTARVYTHLDVEDLRGAVERVPAIGEGPTSVDMRRPTSRNDTERIVR